MLPQKLSMSSPPYLCDISTRLANSSQRDSCVLELLSPCASNPQNCSA